MRFDDRLATALGQLAETPAARQAVWRQLVDLLGQPGSEDHALRPEALARLRAWRAEVSPSSRQSAAIDLSHHDAPADLIEFFAADLTVVAAPLLAAVRLSDSEWIGLIPHVSPVARSLLRHRRDLPPGAQRLLEAYGPTDLVIPAPLSPPEAIGAQDIQALRARVDALREARLQAPAEASAPPEVVGFEFETGPEGVVHWCDLPHRGAVIGLTIAEPAAAGGQGVDGQTAGAFRHRAPFRNARLSVAHGAAAGAWAISGVPSFDPASGRFLGYRGGARRPRAGERADQPGLLGLTLTSDSARQFAHEMRTPLNAIAGFAEMIQRQMLGPASVAYRERADRIVAEAERIGAVLDELEEAAHLTADGVCRTPEKVDCALLLARVTAVLSPAAADRAVPIALSIAPECAPALIDPAAAERLVVRLASACVGAARPGERIEIAAAPADTQEPATRLSVSRPAALAGMGEEALFDACEMDGAADDSPLGLGFSLRLVRQMADACGARLQLSDTAFALVLPAVPANAAGAATAQDASIDWTEWLLRQPPGAACQVDLASAIAADPAGPVAQR